MRFDIEAVRDQAGVLALPVSKVPDAPTRLVEVTGTVEVETDASQAALDALVEHIHHRCPVANMLIASGCRIDLTYKAVPARAA